MRSVSITGSKSVLPTENCLDQSREARDILCLVIQGASFVHTLTRQFCGRRDSNDACIGMLSYVRAKLMSN